MFRIAAVPRVIVGLAALAILAGLGVAPGAQEPPQDAQQPVFRGGVDLVSVDAVVTDRSGKPVTDLTAADFEVREDGRPQTISTFRFIQSGIGPADPGEVRDILSSTDHRIETTREANRLIVIFLDDYHVRRENGQRVKEQLAAFVSELSPYDLVAIATPFSSVSATTFSRNHRATAGNLMGFQGRKYDYTPRNAIEQRYQQLTIQQQEEMRNSIVIRQLASICSFLGTLRDGRKTVVYVSEGMSALVPGGVAVTGAQTGTGRTASVPNDPNRQSFEFFEQSSLLMDLQTRVMRTAARNNVSIYPLDPRGVAAFEFDMDSTVSMTTDRRIIQDSINLLRTIAEQTDGRAIVSNNDPLPGLRQMVRDSSSYYLLAYSSSAAPRDGKFHEIQVRVRRPGIEVRARRGYWAYTAEEVARSVAPPPPAASREVSDAISDLAARAPETRSRAVAVWMGSRRGTTERSAVTLAWEMPPAGTANPMDVVDHVSIIATTLSGVEVFRRAVPVSTSAGRPGGVVIFDAPPGPLRVTATAETSRGIRLETSEAAFDVPDFTGTGPQVTSPFLYRGRTARDLQQVRLAESPVPVVSPVFARAERVLIRFGAYGPGGTSPTLGLKLLNQNGQQMAALPAPVAAPGGEFEAELSFGPFPPGDYLIEITADTDGQAIKRLVALRVTG